MLILSNNSRNKGNETMTFDHFIEYNKRNIFLQKIMQEMRQGN